ncbi:MAG: hypothetical protein ACI85F_000699 [Bacteroidia bacterium]|jgi:hypothetical protein
MHDNYNVKRIGEAEFNLLIPLMKNCFGMDASIEYFRWKYTDNPAGSFVGFVAEHKETGEIGAYYGVIAQSFIVNDEPRVIYQSCDTMTHSDHRRKGLFRLLATTCYKALEDEGKLFVIGFGGGQSTPGFLKFGWKRLFDFRYYFKPNLLCQPARLARTDLSKIKDESAIDSIDQGVDHSRSEINGSCNANRTKEGIRWRLSNPYHDYRTAWVDGDEKSYITYYMEAEKMVIFDVSISDLQNSKKIMTHLSRKVCDEGLKGMLSFAKEDGLDAKNLKKLGFVSNPTKYGPLNEKVPFIFYAPEKELEQFESESNWAVTSYDHDSL